MNKSKILMVAMLATAALVSNGENYYFNNPGKSGSFENPDNWMIANRPAQGCPGGGDDVYCTNGLQTVAFETPGATNTISSLLLNRIGYVNNQQMSFDLNGGELHVTNTVALKASRYENMKKPHLEVTNGTLRVGNAITMGGGDNNYNGEFFARGVDIIIEKGNLSAAGASSYIDILNGSTVSLLNGYPTTSNGSADSYPDSRIVVSGAGSRLVGTKGFRLCVRSRMRIADKAVAEFSGYSVTGQYGRQNRSSIGVDLGGTTGSSKAVLEVDDALMSVTNGACLMLAEADRNSQFHHEIIVRNNGRLNFSGNTQLVVAYIQNGAGTARATNNVIRVYNGGQLDSDGNTCDSEWADVGSITFGISGNALNLGDNGVHVSNGLVRVNHLTLSGAACASNNWLRVEGRAARVILTQKYAAPGNLPTNRRNPALGLCNNSRVEFVLDEDGFDNPPIEMTTTLGIVDGRTQNEALGQKARIVIEDRGFARRHPQETITLIKTLNANNRACFETLVANAEFKVKREQDRGVLSVSEDGKSLLYTAPPARGLMLILR